METFHHKVYFLTKLKMSVVVGIFWKKLETIHILTKFPVEIVEM